MPLEDRGLEQSEPDVLCTVFGRCRMDEGQQGRVLRIGQQCDVRVVAGLREGDAKLEESASPPDMQGPAVGVRVRHAPLRIRVQVERAAFS